METENAHIVHEEWEEKKPHGVKEENKVKMDRMQESLLGWSMRVTLTQLLYLSPRASVFLKQI